MNQLEKIRVAVLATDGVEESEIVEPLKALRNAGINAEVLTPSGNAIQMMQHDEKTGMQQAQGRIADSRAGDYQALVLPGGALNADNLRMIPEAREFVREIDMSGKTMAVICHAPWLLVSAGLAKGRTLTSYHTIQDDIRNAGGTWVDREVAIDRNLITSRSPKDLPAFNRALLEALATAEKRQVA
ncbi:MAG: type 1 glutamine amidotransferase domain-containing protein [Dehalococcoidia bacterium]